MNYAKRAREVLDIEIEGLKKARKCLGGEFASGIRLMLDCLGKGGKIVVTGVGKNYHIAQKISATLLSTGSTSVVLNPTQAMHGDFGILARGDVLLALSYSGESEEILALIPAVQRTGVPIVALTGERNSNLARHSDVVICAAVGREACPFNMAPTASTTAAMAVGDAIAMVLLEARGFRKEDYAKLHPGGSIGRTLLLRVSDIMRTGERLAVVQKGATVKDAIFAMTRARSGSAAVTDKDDRLLGIVTDGDLRRHITTDRNLITRKVADIMTRSPISIVDDQLAVHVLRLFEERSIDDVLVVNREGRLVGAIDIQDLPKLKIL
ncbi:MAG: KpsF/GutQ family sugar-phosphate isomerase [bacterium]